MQTIAGSFSTTATGAVAWKIVWPQGPILDVLELLQFHSHPAVALQCILGLVVEQCIQGSVMSAIAVHTSEIEIERGTGRQRGRVGGGPGEAVPT